MLISCGFLMFLDFLHQIVRNIVLLVSILLIKEKTLRLNAKTKCDIYSVLFQYKKDTAKFFQRLDKYTHVNLLDFYTDRALYFCTRYVDFKEKLLRMTLTL